MLLYIRTLNTDQQIEPVVWVRALSVMFKVTCYARV